MTTDFDRPLTIGTYKPTETFKSAPMHVAVCFEDDSTLVAVTGYADDQENVKESIDYARLFAASPHLLYTLKEIKDALAYHAAFGWDGDGSIQAAALSVMAENAIQSITNEAGEGTTSAEVKE